MKIRSVNILNRYSMWSGKFNKNTPPENRTQKNKSPTHHWKAVKKIRFMMKYLTGKNLWLHNIKLKWVTFSCIPALFQNASDNTGNAYRRKGAGRSYSSSEAWFRKLPALQISIWRQTDKRGGRRNFNPWASQINPATRSEKKYHFSKHNSRQWLPSSCSEFALFLLCKKKSYFFRPRASNTARASATLLWLPLSDVFSEISSASNFCGYSSFCLLSADGIVS